MSQLETGGQELGRIHRASNDKKFFCYFTGFVEGIVASGSIEQGEIEPLLRQCEEFVLNVTDGDANDIVQDFNADLLDHPTLVDVAHFRASEIDLACPKSSTNRFLGFCAAIACDDVILTAEAEAISRYANEHPEIMDDPFARRVVRTCIEAIDDGVVDAEESIAICHEITRLVGDAYCDTGFSSLGATPVFETVELDEDLSILDQANVVLTGEFSIRPRRLIELALARVGSSVQKSVSQKTTYVIIASEASRDWVHTHKGTKIIKALQLREVSGQPLFIDEADLMRCLKLDG